MIRLGARIRRPLPLKLAGANLPGFQKAMRRAHRTPNSESFPESSTPRTRRQAVRNVRKIGVDTYTENIYVFREMKARNAAPAFLVSGVV